MLLPLVGKTLSLFDEVPRRPMKVGRVFRRRTVRLEEMTKALCRTDEGCQGATRLRISENRRSVASGGLGQAKKRKAKDVTLFLLSRLRWELIGWCAGNRSIGSVNWRDDT